MDCAAEVMNDDGGIAFDYLDYLGCREEVLSFYVACGWNRISAAERSISRTGQSVPDPPGRPLLVLPVWGSLRVFPAWLARQITEHGCGLCSTMVLLRNAEESWVQRRRSQEWERRTWTLRHCAEFMSSREWSAGTSRYSKGG